MVAHTAEHGPLFWVKVMDTPENEVKRREDILNALNALNAYMEEHAHEQLALIQEVKELTEVFTLRTSVSAFKQGLDSIVRRLSWRAFPRQDEGIIRLRNVEKDINKSKVTYLVIDGFVNDDHPYYGGKQRPFHSELCPSRSNSVYTRPAVGDEETSIINPSWREPDSEPLYTELLYIEERSPVDSICIRFTITDNGASSISPFWGESDSGPLYIEVDCFSSEMAVVYREVLRWLDELWPDAGIAVPVLGRILNLV